MNLFNLLLPPFNLPEPNRRLSDPAKLGESQRYLGVWSKEQLAG